MTIELNKVNETRNTFTAAMIARDSIEDCTSPEWARAHKAAMVAAIAKNEAYKSAYAAGALPKPYWA